MSVQERIRKLDSQGVSGREIARQVGLSRSTVAKYLKIDDYSPKPPSATSRTGSVIHGFESIIIAWLDEDRNAPRKQRHTAQRIFDRLTEEEGYEGTYSPVQRFVKKYRADQQSASDGFLELQWPPGSVQVDFGQADALIAGHRQTLHMLVVTFPFSNMRFVRAYRGETAECVCHGLRSIFDEVGGAPTLMIFDNATGVGRRVRKKITETKLFEAFKNHYRSQSRFCNPESGHEKGNVENAVGFLRRNIMVPIPAATSVEQLNELLAVRAAKFASKPHWKKRESSQVLFAQDQEALLALPSVQFDPVQYEVRKANKYGHVQVAQNTYAAGPSFATRQVSVGLRHETIELLDEQGKIIRCFPRVFGYHPETISEPSVVLGALARKPGAWSNSPIRAQFADPLKDWIDTADTADRRQFFTALDEASQAAGFLTALDAAEQLVVDGADPSNPSLGMLARRISQGSQFESGIVDLEVYDRLFTVPGQQQTTVEGSPAA
ncbi:IS21 family transposase [Glutamicibacter halophytocola]|uniref:IS21 family transposase n=1 Tax=Glutamicibacter halophytocola TaxID=1933880 RepID=A0ABX5YCF5_9MICC|nr:IS21 family transposase [Glutamicibacter halophytocola]QDY67370.1 IS21 family transposase [Glutamicibacter halophytocola]